MKKYELASSLAWTAVGILFFIGSIRLDPGSLSEPGPGFFPFVMAACLVCFSSFHSISSLIKSRQLKFTLEERFWPESDGIKRILFTIIFLFIFVIALNYLGFILTTYLFLFITLRFIEPRKWLTVILVGSLTTVFSYLIFQFWLRSNLPVGFLGF